MNDWALEADYDQLWWIDRSKNDHQYQRFKVYKNRSTGKVITLEVTEKKSVLPESLFTL